MGVARFRVWFGAQEAGEDDLARIEEIEVTQEVDRFWEARLRMSMCLDAGGRWQHRTDSIAAFSRVRVELDPGSGDFVPLIDGPVAHFEWRLDSQPGRSTATFAVRDDSVFLNREEGTEVFRDLKDSEIADQVFRTAREIAETDIAATEATHPIATRRGTALQFLIERAAENDRHVYVLPGSKPGRSVGCFKPFPRDAGTLPPLRLIGDDRNLADATIQEDSESPEITSGRTLRLADGQLAAFDTSATDLGISAGRPGVPAGKEAKRLLPPDRALRESPEAAASGAAREAGYAFKLESTVIPGCYPAALTPYSRVRIECGRTPYSADWLITKVVHRITPSLYSQRFTARSDAATDTSDAPVAEAPGGGLAVSFSASVGVF
jgi:hypothetical protein